MQFTFAHNNLNVRNLKESIAFYEQALGSGKRSGSRRRMEASSSCFWATGARFTNWSSPGCGIARKNITLAIMNFISHLKRTIWIQPCNAIGRWAASALKTRRWESTLSPIRTAIGLRLFQLNRKGCPQNTTGYKASKRKRPGGFRAALLQLNSVSVLHC